MSLLPSCNKGSATLDYAIANQGTAAEPVSGGVGELNIAPNGVSASYVRTATATNVGSLHLGANPYTFDSIVLTSAPSLTTINTNTVVNAGLTVNGASRFVTSIDINNQQIQNNLRYTQAFGPIPDGTNNGAIGTPQPPLIAGSYAIYVQVTGAPQIQPSAIGYWNGAQWSAGGSGTAVSYPGGGAVLNFRPDPATLGAALCISNASGGPVSGFVYYASLGEN